MQNKLREIVNNKINELKDRKKKGRDFAGSIIHPEIGNVGVIAEIKLASPTAGILGSENEIISRAVMYEEGGADAISVVTDKKYFGGNTDLVRKIKEAVLLPLLMKDFILDPFQVYEAKIIGADALLFIAKILTKRQLKNLVSLAFELGIEPVVEIQNAEELRSVLALSEDIRLSSVEAHQRVECVAVNARNLTDFKVNIDDACKLIRLIPKDKVVLGFSAVTGREEVDKYRKAGAEAVLVGTALMKSERPERLIKTLKNYD